MKPLLYPKHLWQRLLGWLLTVFLCYALLVAIACKIADACDSSPPPGEIGSLPASFFVFAMGCILSPAIAIILELLAFLLPGRSKMNTTDYLVCMLLLPGIHGLALWVLCDFIRISGAWPAAPAIAGWAAAALTLLSLALPLVARLQSPWVRTLAAIPTCWLWGLSLAVLMGAIIDCFVWCGNDPVAIFPYSLMLLPLLSIGGLLPALIPYSLINAERQ